MGLISLYAHFGRIKVFQNLILFIITAVIWGSTWLGIKFQLGTVMPLWSLVYRFSLASLVLGAYCLLFRYSFRFDARQHGWIILQALFIYCTNYILFYMASHYFVSGIVSIIFAGIIVLNIINGRIFLGNQIRPQVVVGSFIGIAGLVCIVWAEVLRLEGQDTQFIIEGLALSIAGTISASLGQIIVVANGRRGIPLIQSNALGYGYGAILMMLIALFLGHEASFDPSWTYTGSLLFLAVFGTVIAFLAYLTLIKRIGADKGAYVFIFTPIIAMALSSLFEDFPWSNQVIVGIILAVIGNILVMTKKFPVLQRARA